HKLFVEEEVVQDFQGARDEEWDANQGRPGKQEAGEERADGGAGGARDSGNSAGSGAFFGSDYSHGVGLASGDVHLADAEAEEEDHDRQRKVGHQRYEDQENVRRQMGEDHGADQTDTRGDSRRQQRGDSGKDIGPEENGAE